MSTAVSNQQKKPAGQMTIRDHLNSPGLMAEIARVLPKHLTPDRMIRVALTALTKTPKLAQCTQASFFECLLNCSQWGLEPDGRRAHLIPYGDKCTLIVDYKGIAELCYRSGNVNAIHADIVRRGDLFEYSCGHVTKHTPWFLRIDADKPKEAGEVFAAYCVVQMRGGTAKHDVMSRDEIEAIRKRSRAGSSGPWVTDWNEMAKKTVFRRCSKWLPWSAEILDAVDGDDDQAIDIDHRPTPTRIAASLDSLVAEHAAGNDTLTLDTSESQVEGGPPAWEMALADCETVEQCDTLLDKWQDDATAAAAITAKLASLKQSKRSQRNLTE